MPCFIHIQQSVLAYDHYQTFPINESFMLLLLDRISVDARRLRIGIRHCCRQDSISIQMWSQLNFNSTNTKQCAHSRRGEGVSRHWITLGDVLHLNATDRSNWGVRWRLGSNGAETLSLSLYPTYSILRKASATSNQMLKSACGDVSLSLLQNTTQTQHRHSSTAAQYNCSTSSASIYKATVGATASPRNSNWRSCLSGLWQVENAAAIFQREADTFSGRGRGNRKKDPSHFAVENRRSPAIPDPCRHLLLWQR